MNADAQKAAAQAWLHFDNIVCLRREEFVGGAVCVWEAPGILPALQACTMELGGDVLVLDRSLEEFERGFAALKPDVAKVAEFRAFFELAAPGIRRFVEPDRPEAISLGAINPNVGVESARWIVDDYSSGLVEEFRMDRRTYALHRTIVGRCKPILML